MKKTISLGAVIALVVSTIGLTSTPVTANFPDQTGGWADSVYSFTQGLRKDGTAVPSELSDPWQALGPAEGLDPALVIPAGSGTTLGYRGELIVKFDNTILNGPGPDIQIVPVHDGAVNSRGKALSPKSLLVAVSQNCWNYRNLGVIRGDGKIDLKTFRWAKCVKLVDRANKAAYDATSAGYAVDGVYALNTTADQPWVGTTHDSRWYRIDADFQNDIWDTHTLKNNRGEASGFCGQLWDEAITFRNNYLENPVAESGVPFTGAYFSSVGKSYYDGQTIEQLYQTISTMSCDRLTHRDVTMRSLLQQLQRINKTANLYLWVAAETPVTP